MTAVSSKEEAPEDPIPPPAADGSPVVAGVDWDPTFVFTPEVPFPDPASAAIFDEDCSAQKHAGDHSARRVQGFNSRYSTTTAARISNVGRQDSGDHHLCDVAAQ